MKPASIYIDGMIHPDFDKSPFFQKAERITKNKALKTAILVGAGTSQKVIHYFTDSSLNIVFDEKKISDSSIVMTSDPKMLRNLQAKGFTTLFIIDEYGEIGPNLFYKVRETFDVHYLTTSKVFKTCILNDTITDDKFFLNTMLFIDPQISLWTSLVLERDKEFFRTLCNADILKQPFLSETNYFLSEQNKPLRLLDAISKKTETISVSDISLSEISERKAASLHKIGERLEDRRMDDREKAIEGYLNKLTPLITKMASNFEKLERKIDALEDKIEEQSREQGQQFTFTDSFDDSDPLSIVRNHNN
ncbi:hypothetical protein [Streptococcus sp. DTU_2020_1000888_1_SI_GRL_NUU_041A]|uniref:hypothetical protein n=1 Tax=Streptococcus sp. DTU_2020_1000888_1_SI_GRL_NUU_041A TaxID=3077723 RepID=UPI0028E268AC|nr:hypothetical protein [Streptococcus sp. DTU_2020_1000888_1_SI_GRL_NUU_041A]WNU96073.1 hypothetical protein RSK81_12585 [Streptococcus sp. DTU_2020_1000888_1_SI_GRL_NUU_041A]